LKHDLLGKITKNMDSKSFFRGDYSTILKDDLADCFLQGLWYLKYGQTGTKAPMTSSHQKLVYRENNRLQYKKIRARAPNKKSIASKRYTLSNIKWFMTKGKDVNDNELKTSIEFFFGDIDYFYGVLKNT